MARAPVEISNRRLYPDVKLPHGFKQSCVSVGTLPTGAYYAIISRAKHRPKCEVYAWALSDKLPMIPIPLKLGDADASVPLQEVFDIIYRRARYDLSVKYDAPLDPPPTPDELRRVQLSSNQW